jgi:OOP family OmpA-OmpF porin
MLSKKIVPYLAAGAGAIVISGDATSKAIPLFNYGFGMKYVLKDYLALRADARHLLTFKNAASRNNFELSVGLSYYFGKESAKKIVPLPKEKPPVKEPQEKAQEPITTKVPLPVPELESEAPEAPPETAPAREQDNGPAPAELPEKPAPHPSTPSSGIDCYYTLAARGVVNRKELEPLLKKLKTAGRQAAVRKETRATEGYRLTSESYKEKQSALKHQDELDRRYRNSFIVREGESWCIIVGSYITEDIALQEQQRLAGKNVPVRVVRAKISLPVWRITSGRYPDQQQAEDAVKILAELGIETSVVKVCPGTADHEGQILVNELTIEFGVDQYDVMPHYSGQIEEIARTLKSSPASTAIIEGHTDNTGMRSHNLKLSQRRAQSVKNSLVNFGIDPKRIVIKAFGSSRPIADNETTTGRQRNRRAVEVVIVSH